MNDEFARLKKALKDLPPIPSSRQRATAIAAAAVAFERHHQGFRRGMRLKGQTRKRIMSWLPRIPMPHPLFAFAGLAACLLVAVAIGYNTHWFPGTEEQRMAAAPPENRTAEGASNKTVPPGPISQPATLPPGHQSRTRSMERGLTGELGPLQRAGDRIEKGNSVRSSEQPPHYMLQYPHSNSLARVRKFAPEELPATYPQRGGNRFMSFDANPVKRTAEDPVSTFSIDVDTASYGFMRASLNRGVLPPPNAVRTEELVNYFTYGYAPPENGDTPFAVHASLLPTPWNDKTRLMHIGIKGYVPERESRPRASLVFLIDSSGSMDRPAKLPLLKSSFKLLLGALAPSDSVAIVTYAGAAGTVLPPTKAAERNKITAALERLDAGGSTAGAEGIRQAYLLAEQHFVEDGINRVILATDGDFNVGIADPEQLEGYIARKRDSGIYLSVLGFGMGNYNDELMQRLAQSGNGNAAYIDGLSEARKVLVEEAGSTLFTIARDVKIQVEFNPALIAEYRLIGYETRMLGREDFRNDKVDAGEIGAGHTVTALYEVALAGAGGELTAPLRYGKPQARSAEGSENEFATMSIRYKKPNAGMSAKIVRHITRADMHGTAGDASEDIRFAASVAAFGQILRGGRFTGNYDYDDVIAAAQAARGEDPFGYRAEFIGLVRLAKTAVAMEPMGQQ